MSVNERIRLLRDAIGKNPTQFSADVGVPRTTLLGWEGGKSVPIETAEKIKSAYPDVDLQWLITGKGQMFHSGTFEKEGKCNTVLHLPEDEESDSGIPEGPSGPLPIDLGALALITENEVTELEGARLEGARSLEMSGPASADDVVYVDFYSGQIAGAGPAREVEVYQPVTPQAILRRFISPWRPSQIRALEVRGDSMTKVSIFDRDIVLFVPEEKEGDGIFVISIENKMQVKRLEFDILGRTLRIISENDRYQPRILSEPGEIERVMIEGKVIGVLHRHPY